FLPGVAGHQELVVAGVPVPDRGGYGQRDRDWIEGAACRAAADAAAAAGTGVCGDGLGPLARAAREELPDRRRELGLELHVLVRPPLLRPESGPAARLLVGEAVGLGLLERRLLDEDPLPFVALSGPAEADDDRRERAGPLRAAGEGGVAGRQED